MIRRLLVLGATLWGSVAGAQEPVIRLIDPGQGAGPSILAEALARPHVVVAPAANRYVFSRGSDYPRTVVVLGRDAVLEGHVHGDVITVGGDLYMHPGGHIDGRAIAIGGGVYHSALAVIAGGSQAFGNFTYDITSTGNEFSLTYRSLFDVAPVRTFALAGIGGVSIPSYDRTNGLSLPIGVTISLPQTPLVLDPRLTYRSNLGRLDPSLAGQYQLDSRTSLTGFVGRATFTNEQWIRSDLLNSLHYFALGKDARNYFRATRAEVLANRSVTSNAADLQPYVGVRAERASSARPYESATGGPWAVIGRHSIEDVLRPNPPVGGTVVSGLAGARIRWKTEEVVAAASIDEEVGAGPARPFGQTTIDGSIAFPTFGTQSMSVDAHGIVTAGTAPRQRWSYVGGSGTIPTTELLEYGGDQLVYVDARYNVPVAFVQLPFIGPPVVSVRELLGGTSVGRFPTLRQATGLRLSAGFVYGEFLVDPARRHARLSGGFAMPH